MTSLVDQYVGATAYDVSGDKIGKIGKLFVDGRSREPRWAAVRMGLFRKTHALIPLTGSRQEGRSVTVTVTKAAVKDAPKPTGGEGVTLDEAAELSRHYRLDEPQPDAPEPPAPHSTALNIASVAAGIGGTAVNTAAWNVADPAENQHPDTFEEPEPSR